MPIPAIAIHGGAGTILRANLTSELEAQFRSVLRDTVLSSWKILASGGTSLDAVVNAVMIMEDDPLFNAGKGSVFNSAGRHEMDASVMNGKDLNAGAVSLISNVKNPVKLARVIMEKTSHIFISGDEATKIAVSEGLETETDEYFFTQSRFDQLTKARLAQKTMLDHSAEEGKGTVGAVAIDMQGNLSAATSTGGMTNKLPGRIGDSAIIGAGTYANNKTCAVSCTGHGEYFMRNLSAFDVSAMMEYSGMSLKDACNKVIFEKLSSSGGSGGLIAVDSQGNICMTFNSEGMYRACMQKDSEEPFTAIFKNDL